MVCDARSLDFIVLLFRLGSTRVAVFLVQVDSRYSVLCSHLAEWENRGLLLRWAGALINMEAVKSIPKAKLETFVRRYRVVIPQHP